MGFRILGHYGTERTLSGEAQIGITVQGDMLVRGIPISSNPIFLDTFNYVVTRDDPWNSMTDNPFVANGGWTQVKSMQIPTETGARGYMYTVTSIPGYSGAMPGISGSGRVLCAEFLGATLGQTDLYLMIGSESGLPNDLPADIWIQFWMYLQNYGAQAGDIDDMKFLYPSKTTLTRPHNEMWLSVFKNMSKEPYNITAPSGFNGYFSTEQSEAACWAGAPSWDCYKLGSNVESQPAAIMQNGWRLVRMHFDMSGVSVPGGIEERWVRSYGAPTFTKQAEWIHGQQVAGYDFVWPLADYNGAKFMQLFTTTNYNGIIYMADFAIAAGVNSGGAGELDLPAYPNY